MLGIENAGALIGPVVISLIVVPLGAEEVVDVLELEGEALPLEPDALDELELLLPQAATTSAVTIATAITPRR